MKIRSPYEEDPYPYHPHAAYGRSDYNVQNAFKLFGLWQPVFFHGYMAGEKSLGGWSLGGIFNVHSGFPFNPVYNTTGPLLSGQWLWSASSGEVPGRRRVEDRTTPFLHGSNAIRTTAAMRPDISQRRRIRAGTDFPRDRTRASAGHPPQQLERAATIRTWTPALTKSLDCRIIGCWATMRCLKSAPMPIMCSTRST